MSHRDLPILLIQAAAESKAPCEGGASKPALGVGVAHCRGSPAQDQEGRVSLQGQGRYTRTWKGALLPAGAGPLDRELGWRMLTAEEGSLDQHRLARGC